jgi:hypothetical protein
VKRSNNSGYQALFSANNGNSTAFDIAFNGDNFGAYLGIGPNLVAAAVYRDFSAWYHILCAADTTQATASNRIKLYINGEQITAFSASNYPSQNFDYDINNTTAHAIGRIGGSSSGYFSGYLADIYFIDGQALTPSSFTETDATTGQLIPLAYTGSYGTNGFHLEFSDNSGTTSTTLGKDSAGSNNWTPNNFSVSSGAGNDSLVDVPTNGAQTDTGVGGEVRGNYCTLNPLKYGGDIQAPTNGNLDVTSVGSATGKILGTIGVSSGKWYWECVPNSSANIAFGITKDNTVLANYPGQDAVDYSYHSDGSKYSNNSGSSYGATFTTNDIIGVAFDADNGTLTFYKNNSSQGQAYSGLTSGPYFPMVGDPSSTPDISATVNFGARSFAYTAPSGFKALCSANLPAPAVVKSNTVFDVKLYTGNGSTQTISGLGFSPDFVWIKNRSAGDYHRLNDIIRGANRHLFSNTTDAEVVNDANGYLSAFTSDGFSLTSGTGVNASGNSYAAWCWDAGSSTVTNTQGSISSQVRANATAGFSIVTYTGTGANATVGHGLGVAPSMVIVKSRNAANDWAVYHAANTAAPATDYLLLNSTEATADDNTYWNDTAPTSTVFSIGTNADVNTNTTTYVAYCFAPVNSYSAFGSYTGNGSADGPFVYTGFRPRWIMIKPLYQYDGGGSTVNSTAWYIYDSARGTYNGNGAILGANNSYAEENNATDIDFLSNGFKLRNTRAVNTSNGAIYAAFAEAPFNYARAR